MIFKKAAKVGWDRLGILDPQATQSPQQAPKAAVKPVKAAPPAPTVKAPLPAASEGSPRQRIEKLLAIGLDSAGIAQKVYDIKKAAKKNWNALGVSDAQAATILKAVGKE